MNNAGEVAKHARRQIAMECSKIQEKLGFYLDGVLDEQSLEGVETHLAECDVCRRELSALRMLVETAGDVETIEPPTGLRESILQAVRSEEKAAQSLAKTSDRLSFGEWLRSYASPKSLRWAAGAVAAGIVALVMMIGTVHQPTQVRQAAVRTQDQSPSTAPTAPSQPTKAAVAKPPTVDMVQQAVGQTRQVRTASSWTHSRVKIRMAKSHKHVTSKLAKKSARPIVARVDTGANVERDSEVISEVEPAEVEVTEVTTASDSAESAEADVDAAVVVRVAAAPVLNNDKIHEWMQDAKTQAEMRKGGGRGAGVSIVSARF